MKRCWVKMQLKRCYETKGIGTEPNSLEINLLDAQVRQKQSKSQSACEERDELNCHLALRQWRVKKLFLKIF